jgi:hypothetical protein
MSNKPAYIAYTVRERGKGKPDFWVRIGGAWPFQNENGSGFTVQLDALPIDGRIVLCEPKAGDEARSAE